MATAQQITYTFQDLHFWIGGGEVKRYLHAPGLETSCYFLASMSLYSPLLGKTREPIPVATSCADFHPAFSFCVQPSSTHPSSSPGLAGIFLSVKVTFLNPYHCNAKSRLCTVFTPRFLATHMWSVDNMHASLSICFDTSRSSG